jgi:hypothetical protein
MSCGQEQADDTLPPEEPVEVIPEEPDPRGTPYAVAEIENLQTRLRVFDTKGMSREYMLASALRDPVTQERLWRWDPKDVISHFPPRPEHYNVDTYFGYADEDQTLLCEVINLPEAALQWEEDYFSETGLGSRTEIYVQMSGTVRLYIDSAGKKYGTMELTSLEPSGTGIEYQANLQLGLYIETYPLRGQTLINFIDKETMEITKIYVRSDYQETVKWKYEIRDNHFIWGTRIEEGDTTWYQLIRVVSDSKFEMRDYHVITAEYASIVMTFEKVSNN